ncbi:type I phosphomannose isomerase catalytic subunit [Aquimarina gracilis]|uniref:Phosphohexomutase n=1 Tax=Aquimarina gracilis TaxID=874422 RepID=A0ABU6A0X7_9FLAO|nr:type I phosphomannose isomerase catalytic subunit [Aquimarina gracilis]MEB3347751.1 type I phosphomannose isomerase catalytic subunit [Aquimarina gracilis]
MLYPIKFHSILKEKIWGGDKLKTLLNKASDKENIGESWEISTVDEDISVVANGAYQGENLVQLIKNYKEDLLGKKVYQEFGNQFPLLIKFIDAKEDLSVQLHPNDELAKKRHNSFGKTEMWYVMQADENARLIVGFNKDTSKEEYSEFLENRRIHDLLNEEQVKKGDSYFISEGTIHAIGGGTLIAEIQQTSDITYRVYDWDRKDDQGNERELHTELAIDALDYNYNNNYKQNYSTHENVPNEITSCDYFTTNYLTVDKYLKRTYTNIDSFKIYMCVDGEGSITANKNEEPIKKGETILIPAALDHIEIRGAAIELLEIYIK